MNHTWLCVCVCCMCTIEMYQRIASMYVSGIHLKRDTFWQIYHDDILCLVSAL